MLDAISWDIESLYDVFEVLKFWSTLVDLLGNISTLFGERLVKKWVKMGKNANFSKKIFYIRVCREF